MIMGVGSGGCCAERGLGAIIWPVHNIIEAQGLVMFPVPTRTAAAVVVGR